MSNKIGGGQGAEGKLVFLSAHRCPEVDLLPHTANKLFKFNSRSEGNYLDLSPTHCYEDKGEEEEEGEISDWSEEDLSLHFSPSVVLQSDDEDSGPESSFECVDVTVETQVNGQKNDGLKMVPKRQIHLRKQKESDGFIDQETTDKPQAGWQLCVLALKPGKSRTSKRRKLESSFLKKKNSPKEFFSSLAAIRKDGPVGQKRANSEVSAFHCPHLLVGQQSTPISLTTNSDVIGCEVYRGLTTGGYQGFQAGQRCLQKSFSLDESKTKMASCIIRNVLLKKMQVEQNSSNFKKQSQVLPVRAPATEQQNGVEWCKTGMVNDLVPVMGDDRSSVKNTCSFSLPMNTTTPSKHKITSFTNSGQVDGRSSTYQHVLGIKGHTTTFLRKSSDRKQSDTSYCPITQQRQGIKPITSKVKVEDTPVRQSKKAAGESLPLTLPHPPTSRLPQQTQVLPSVQEQRSDFGVSSQSTPGSSQTMDTCFYKSPSSHPHMDNVTYVQSLLSSNQTQVQPIQPATTLQLQTRSQDQIRFASKSINQIVKVCPPYVIKSTEDQEEHGGKVKATTQQLEPQQQFVHSIQSFLPAQVCGHILTSSHRATFAGTVPSHMTIDLTSRQYLHVDMPPQLQSKTLLDPETGQFVQVFLPSDRVNPTPTIITPFSTLIHMAGVNPTSAVLQVGGANVRVSVMQLQPMEAVSSLYIPLHLPFILHIPRVYVAP